MKKIFAILSLTIMLTACGNSNLEGYESFNGSDFSFSYPNSYELKKAATTFIFNNSDGETALSMNRYVADDLDQVTLQMNSVAQNCSYEKGGTKYGGYKAYSIVANDETCKLEGSIVGNNKGMYMLFIEEEANAEELQKSLKDSFKFEN